MTDIKDNSSFSPGTSGASNASKPEDQAALALKSSVLADAHDLTDGAKQIAGDAVAQVRESAQAQVSGGKDRLADGLGNVANAIRDTGDRLREGDQTGLTQYVTRAADGVEAASDYLKENSLGDVLGDLGSFARREPAMFLGGAFVLGLLGGRFLKSSHVKPSPAHGGLQSSQVSRTGKQGIGQPNQGGSRGNGSTPSLSIANKPGVGDRPRDTGSASRSQDGGAKLPGTV